MRWLLFLLLTTWAFGQEHLLKIPQWLPAEVKLWSVSGDGERLLTLPERHREAPLELWDVKKGKCVARLLDSTYHVSARFLPDGKVAALAESMSDSGLSSVCAWVWDRDGKVLRRQPDLGGDFADQSVLLKADTLVLYSWQNYEKGDENGGLRWSGGQVQSWHWPTGKLKRLADLEVRLEQVALSYDARWLVTLGGDAMLGVWDVQKSRLVAKRFRVSCFTLAPNRVVTDEQILSLPKLQKLGTWKHLRDVVVSGSTLYYLDGDNPGLLGGVELQHKGSFQIESSAGFELSEAIPVGTLPLGKLILWDLTHRAVGVTQP